MNSDGGSRTSPKLPWWATKELPAALLAAALISGITAVIGACFKRDWESIGTALCWAGVTLLFFAFVRFAPRISNLQVRRSVSGTLRRAIWVFTCVCHVLWSPFAVLFVGAALTTMSTSILQHLIGIWMVLFGVIRSVEKARHEQIPLFVEDFALGFTPWSTRSGHPRIDEAVGKPPPSLFLPFVGKKHTHSFAYMKRDIADGEVQCDVHLAERGAVGIVFRAEVENDRYYVARLSADPQLSSALCRSDGPETPWRVLGTSAPLEVRAGWHRLRVSFRGQYLMLFDGDELVVSASDGSLRFGCVGVFNERGQVYVDNFQVTSVVSGVREVVRRLLGVG